MRIKQFSDCDFDGVSCGILGHLAFGDNIDIKYTSPQNIDTEIKKYIDSKMYENYEITFITDLSINEENAKLINNNDIKVTLIDHHKTALWLNKYDWCSVKVEDEKGLTCGASLFYKFLSNIGKIQNKFNLYMFIENVRKYDTWEWKKDNYTISKLWNDLLYLVGREDFVKQTIQKIQSDSIISFTLEEEAILYYNQKKINKYIETKAKNIISMKLFDYNAGIVFADQYTSELGDILGETFTKFDFIAMVNMDTKRISYRTNKENIDLSKIAKKLGGGGHTKAAGNPIENKYLDELLINIFKSEVEYV